MRRALALVVGALAASGCLLTTSLDDLSKGDDGATTPEGGGGNGDGPAEVAPDADAATGADGGGTADGGTTPGVDGGPVTTWCTTQTETLCEDFDREPLASAWSVQKNSGSGCSVLVQSGASPTSASKALVTTSRFASGSTKGHAVTVSCSVRIDKIDSNDYSNGISIVATGGRKGVYAQLG